MDADGGASSLLNIDPHAQVHDGTYAGEAKSRSKILVPVLEDWSIVGTTLNNLRARRNRETKNIPKIFIEMRTRITNDVLIARTAKRENVTVLTDNTADFEKIRNYCAVQIINGKEYFGE